MSAGGSAIPLAFGPLFQGYFVSTALFGVVVAQGYIYSISSARDPVWKKCLTYFLFLCETSMTIYSSYATYILGIHLSHRETVPGSFGVALASQYIAIITLIGSITTAISHVYIGWRLILSDCHYTFPMAIAVTSMISLLMGIGTGADMLQSIIPGSFGRAIKGPRNVFMSVPFVWLSARAATDGIIAVCVAGLMLTSMNPKRVGKKTVVEWEGDGIQSIYPLAFVTAILSICELVELRSSVKAPRYLTIELVLTHLHIVAFFSAVNARTKQTQRTLDDVVRMSTMVKRQCERKTNTSGTHVDNGTEEGAERRSSRMTDDSLTCRATSAEPEDISLVEMNVRPGVKDSDNDRRGG